MKHGAPQVYYASRCVALGDKNVISVPTEHSLAEFCPASLFASLPFIRFYLFFSSSFMQSDSDL
jgi:hypothetical protein